MLEKPLGHSLDSARAINQSIGRVFDESRVFRIDHYLGKETVQNLMALRFANALFEPVWRAAHIDHVQISVNETLGVENRGGYYDHAGAMRDMVQNHLLQLLCLVAMEAPVRFDAEAVRNEKLKVLQALKPISGLDVQDKTVRGQYAAGRIGGQEVPAYYFEKNVDNDSDTETFVALQAEVENWRWAGVPFYLRTGKRMARKCSEIVIQFKPVPHSLIDGGGGPANRLWIRLQPEERISVQLMAKTPGKGMQLEPVELDLNLAEAPQPQQAALGRLRAPAAGRDRGRLDAVHAPRRGRGRLGLGRPDPRRLARALPEPAAPTRPAATARNRRNCCWNCRVDAGWNDADIDPAQDRPARARLESRAHVVASPNHDRHHPPPLNCCAPPAP